MTGVLVLHVNMQGLLLHAGGACKAGSTAAFHVCSNVLTALLDIRCILQRHAVAAHTAVLARAGSLPALQTECQALQWSAAHHICMHL